MSGSKSNSGRKIFGAIALSTAVLLGGGTFWMSGQLRAEKEEAPVAVEALRSAHDLSSAFRSVAKSTLPSIVSIQTTGKAMDQGNMEEQFGELFKDNPQFKDMFKNMPKQRRMHPQGMGSGFIIDPSGIVMTNNHVVADAEKITVVLQDGTEYTATDVKTDPRTDVAILRIKSEKPLPAIKLGNSDLMEVGDWVLAIGAPFGLSSTVTQGIISAKGRGMNITDREDFLQTDAAINPGNSGGPLLNLNGEVIGINTAISSRSGGYDGIGFAIPVNMAKWVGDQLVENGRVRRAYLGVAIGAVDPKLAKYLPDGSRSGAVIGKVSENSPASNAKLQESDIILKLDGQEVKDTRSLQGIVERLEVGKSYPMELIRDGERTTVQVTMQEMPEDFSTRIMNRQEDQAEPKQPMSETIEDLGLGLQSLTPAIAKSLGFENRTEGIVITDVKEGSAAEKARLAPEQVITKVGNRPVKTVEEFKEAMKTQDLAKGVLLFVVTPNGGNYVELVK